MATYPQIQEFIKQEYGFSVKTCWIAHVKEMNGLNPKLAHNRKSKFQRINPCPVNKREFIENAMRHFGMIK